MKFLSVIPLVFFINCTSSRVYQDGGPTASGIDVRIDDQMDADSKVWYHQNAVSGALTQAISKQLTKRGKRGKRLEAGQLLDVSVTSFRVRSGSQVFWVGVMAGSDYISANVKLRAGNSITKSFSVSAKSLHSMYSSIATGKLTASRRVDTLCNAIAKDLVEQL